MTSSQIKNFKNEFYKLGMSKQLRSIVGNEEKEL
jgi:hypothetical protein